MFWVCAFLIFVIQSVLFVGGYYLLFLVLSCFLVFRVFAISLRSGSTCCLAQPLRRQTQKHTALIMKRERERQCCCQTRASTNTAASLLLWLARYTFIMVFAAWHMCFGIGNQAEHRPTDVDLKCKHQKNKNIR